MNFFKKMLLQLNEQYSSDAEEMISILKKKMGFKDEDFKRVSNSRFKVLVPSRERYSIRELMSELDGFKVDTSIKGSSMGGVRYKSAIALIKPKEKQGRSSAGLGNEDFFINNINQLIADISPVDVYLNDYKVTNVKKALGVGTKISTYKKTDVVFKRESEEDFNISLKKDNAEIWESADARYKKLVKEFVDEINSGKNPDIYFEKYVDKTGKAKPNIYKMFDVATNKPVSGVIKKIDDVDEVKQIVWGGDEVDVVLVRTFISSDFKIKEDGLHIKVTELVFDLSDLKKYDLWPYLKIRHDVTRNKTFGIRPVVMTHKSIFKNGNPIGKIKFLS